MTGKANRGLHRFALFTAAATFLLIIAGALVTSNDAGLSVPDWPLSYGQLMPPMIGGIFYEHGHRMIASFVGLLTIVLAVWLWRAEGRGWVKKLGLAALGAVVAQGVLGGLTVIFLLPTAVSVGHACLAQLFFSATVILALVTSPGWRRGVPGALLTDAGAPSLRTLCLVANGAVFAQLLMGAGLRHKGFGIIPHLVGAAVVAVLVVWVIARVVCSFAGEAGLLRRALTLNVLVMLQLVLGSASYWIRQLTADYPQPILPMVALTVAHVALGALILATSIVLTFGVWTRVSKPSADFVDRKVVTAA
ncbi:MAG: COX15/CtaA family protein [Bryobacterales bacterium]